MTRRRLLWTLPVVLLIAAAAYSAWLAWQVQVELRAAESSARDLENALGSGERPDRTSAGSELAVHAAAAHGYTSGVWWRALTIVPFLGDDAAGVRAMSTALDVIAEDAVSPLAQAVDRLDGVVSDGRIDLDRVTDLDAPVDRAEGAMSEADAALAAQDSRGYLRPLGMRFDEFAAVVRRMHVGLRSARTALEVLPAMAGADGPRNYLLLFQNNAEVRSSGGMPGSWALVHGEGGRLTITHQGTAGDFPFSPQPVVPLSAEEVEVYGREIGQYFQDPGFTADFPRAAQIWRAHWRARFPRLPLDGIVALDPVGMSYLLDGTGPVRIGDVTLTSRTAVDQLLNAPYVRIADPHQQNVFFQQAASAVFDAATGSLASPVRFVEGLARAARERRLLVAPFDERLRGQLAGSGVAGALAADDGDTPHVDVGVNDLTASKMSYYLRYDGQVTATSCRDGVQRLDGSITLRQSLPPGEAAALPVSVTGGGVHGTDPGSQYVMVRIYGPWGGAIDEVRIDGRELGQVRSRLLDGRPVVSADVLISSTEAVVLSWRGATGQGQIGAGRLQMTPGVTPGDYAASFPSAC